jgi:murein L,D-transpeptidase YafK
MGKNEKMTSRLRLTYLVFVMTFCATIMLAAQGFAASTSTFTKTTVTTETHSAPMADQIVVYKSKRLMYLMKDGHILRKYRVALGKNPMGNKMEWGDFRTPEGRYHIDLKNASSGYFRSLRISYPDNSDADVAAALDVKPGDWVMIHGMPNDRTAEQMHHPERDWTNGCIAVRNDEMAEIWDMVAVGTPISIWP